MALGGICKFQDLHAFSFFMGLLLLRGDAYNGTIDRTFVISSTDGTNTINYAFNGRVSQWTMDPAPGAESKITFTIHPRGNQYGWSNNT